MKKIILILLFSFLFFLGSIPQASAQLVDASDRPNSGRVDVTQPNYGANPPNQNISIPSVQDLAKEISNSCWACDILVVMMSGLDKTIQYAHETLQGPSLQLLALGFAFWVVWLFFKFFTLFGASVDYIQLFSDLFKKTLLVIFIAALLKMSDLSTLRDLVISPLLSASTAYSRLLAEGISSSENMNFTSKDSYGLLYQNDTSLSAQLSKKLNIPSVSEYCSRLDNSQFSSAEGLVSSEFLSPEIQNSFLCTISSINQQFMPPLLIGKIFWLYATGHTVTMETSILQEPPPSYVKTGINFQYFFPAIVLLIVFNIILFFIPFYLLDAILNLCFMIALLPLFLISYAFNFTREYAVKAWQLFVYSILIFITLTTVAPIVMEMYYALFSSEDISSIISYLSGEAGSNNENRIEGLKNFFVDSHGSFYMLLVSAGWCYFAMKFIKMSELLARRLSGNAKSLDNLGTSNTGTAMLGKAMAGAATAAAVVKTGVAAVATGGTSLAAKAGASAVKQGVKQAAKAVSKTVKSTISRSKKS